MITVHCGKMKEARVSDPFSPLCWACGRLLGARKGTVKQEMGNVQRSDLLDGYFRLRRYVYC